MDNLMSERAKISRDWKDFLYEYLSVCDNNPYDEETNPTGYVNLGTGVNNLNMDIIHSKLNDIWTCDFDSLGYKEVRGTMRLRHTMAEFMTKFLESNEPISPENLFCVTGVTSCIDLLAHCLADPGEVFLVPTPVYGRIYTDLKQRSLVEVLPVHVITEDCEVECPELTIEKIISAYKNAVIANKVVRGIFLINPNNPLGCIYSPKLLMDIMTFCKANSLHLIVDEVYALSVFSKTEKFHSILKFSDIPDPERTHVLYGLSKDFGIAGLRIGVIHTKCQQLQKSLIQLCNFQNIPFPVMEIAATLLEDLEWCKMYMSTNQKRMATNHEYCINYLKDIGVKVQKCVAGFFLWVDFRQLCGSSFNGEKQLFKYLLDSFHLYIAPGEEFYCAQPGWFRIVITQNFSHLKEGLKRLKEALKDYKPEVANLYQC